MPKKITTQKQNKITTLYKQGVSQKNIAKQLKLSVMTVHRYVKKFNDIEYARGGAIRSGEAGSLKALEDKLAYLIDRQEKMKLVNKAYKAYKNNPDSLSKFKELTESDIHLIKTFVPQYSWETTPYQKYQLSNNNQNMATVRKRIEDEKRLDEKRQGGNRKYVFDLGTITADVDNNKWIIYYDSIPDASIRSKIKSRGFKWSPTQYDAWIRNYNTFPESWMPDYFEGFRPADEEAEPEKEDTPLDDVKGITVLSEEDDGQTLIYGTKNNTTRLSIKGFDADDIKAELELEIYKKKDAEKKIERIEKDLPSMFEGKDKESAKQILRDSKRIIEISKITIDWLEKKLSESKAKEPEMKKPKYEIDTIFFDKRQNKNFQIKEVEDRDGAFWYKVEYFNMDDGITLKLEDIPENDIVYHEEAGQYFQPKQEVSRPVPKSEPFKPTEAVIHLADIIWDSGNIKSKEDIDIQLQDAYLRDHMDKLESQDYSEIMNQIKLNREALKSYLKLQLERWLFSLEREPNPMKEKPSKELKVGESVTKAELEKLKKGSFFVESGQEMIAGSLHITVSFDKYKFVKLGDDQYQLLEIKEKPIEKTDSPSHISRSDESFPAPQTESINFSDIVFKKGDFVILNNGDKGEVSNIIGIGNMAKHLKVNDNIVDVGDVDYYNGQKVNRESEEPQEESIDVRLNVIPEIAKIFRNLQDQYPDKVAIVNKDSVWTVSIVNDNTILYEFNSIRNEAYLLRVVSLQETDKIKFENRIADMTASLMMQYGSMDGLIDASMNAVSSVWDFYKHNTKPVKTEEQKPEPKFNVGDWIKYPKATNSGKVLERTWRDNIKMYEYKILFPDGLTTSDYEDSFILGTKAELTSVGGFKIGDKVSYKGESEPMYVHEFQKQFDGMQLLLTNEKDKMGVLSVLAYPDDIKHWVDKKEEPEKGKLTNHTDMMDFLQTQNLNILLDEESKIIAAINKNFTNNQISSHNYFPKEKMRKIEKLYQLSIAIEGKKHQPYEMILPAYGTYIFVKEAWTEFQFLQDALWIPPNEGKEQYIKSVKEAIKNGIELDERIWNYISKDEVVDKEPPKEVIIKTQQSIIDAPVEDLIASYKHSGMDNKLGWSQFIKDRLLKPEIDAKEFYKIWQTVSARPLTTETNKVEFIATHYDNLQKMHVQNTQMDGYVKHLWEDGSTGSTPNKYITEERFKSLKSEQKPDNLDWLFIGGYPTGTTYSDKRKESGGDYHQIAFVFDNPPAGSPKVKIYDDSKPEYKEVIANIQKEQEAEPEPEIELEVEPEPKLDPSKPDITAAFANPYELNKAIEALIDYKDANGESYYPEELIFINKYSGYGGLQKFGAKGKGILYEFFTPDEIIKRMWGLAWEHGYKGGDVLENSCGTGRFFKYLPKTANAVGLEINRYSNRICQILYPRVEINTQTDPILPKDREGNELKFHFDSLFIKDKMSIKNKIGDIRKFDLVIGNPPYGKYDGRHSGIGEGRYTKAANYIDYFIFRGLDCLNTGGLLIYIIGAEVSAGGVPFLDQKFSKNKCKAEIRGKSELLDAYRLPNGLFDQTDVLTDLIVLRKL